MIATSDRPDDDPICAFAEAEDAALFRGDLDDVGGRALACAQAFGFSRFARVCGDRPFFDPGLVARQWAMMDAQELDLATNILGARFPAGMASEVIRTKALARALAVSEGAQDREHVTPYFYRTPTAFRTANIEAPDLTWAARTVAVDDQTDLARARWIAGRLADPAAAPSAEIVELAARWDGDNLGADSEGADTMIAERG